jgi:hypothetical protein
MNYLHTIPGVQFAVISPAGFALLAVLWQTAQELGRDLIITSGTDGAHSGPMDPHHLGCAYDVRSHDMDEATKSQFIQKVLAHFQPPVPSSGGYITDDFFGWLEQPGTPDEHFHLQLRKGHVYPPSNNSGDVQEAATAT